jgi:predicted glycoside hydrolase/deacetylase ChbG (UPF0249 family)
MMPSSSVAATGAARANAPPERAICVCIDDFGLHPGVNDATAKLVQQGRVHAVGAMVGAPAFRDGAAILRAADAHGVDIGLHLDLTEHPLRPGSRRSLRGWIVASYLRLVDAQAIRDEITAQLDAFEQVVGHGPAYVDGHQHVHQLPGVREHLLDELSKRDPSARTWLRSTQSPATEGAAKSRVIEALGSAALAEAAARLGHRQNAHLLGVYDFKGGADRYRTLLKGWLQVASAGDLLMCHPSTRTLTGDAITDARCIEYGVLSGDAFGEMLGESGVVLGPMSQILAGAPVQA